jgi:hypothetical protein
MEIKEFSDGQLKHYLMVLLDELSEESKIILRARLQDELRRAEAVANKLCTLILKTQPDDLCALQAKCIVAEASVRIYRSIIEHILNPDKVEAQIANLNELRGEIY